MDEHRDGRLCEYHAAFVKWLFKAWKRWLVEHNGAPVALICRTHRGFELLPADNNEAANEAVSRFLEAVEAGRVQDVAPPAPQPPH